MIEKLEVKINKIKRKIDPRIAKVGIFMLFGALIIFSLEMTNNFKREKNSVQDEYNKAMYLAVSYINNVQVDLEKIMVTSTPRMNAITFADIWKQSNLAKESLEQIPASQNSLSNASKFLTQVSDFSYSLMNKNINENKITDEEYEKIKQVHENLVTLSSKMQDIYDDLNDGKVKWDELEKYANKELPNIELGESLDSFAEVSKAFQKYEGLIYDGAFSDHNLNIDPKNIGEKEYSQEDAKEFVNKIFEKENIKEVKEKGESKGRIDLYNFEVSFSDKKEVFSLSITKKGCKLYLMVGDKNVKEEKLSIDDAKKRGIEFLEKLGITNMKDTYYQKSEKIAVINYAAVQDGVVLYPDLIKIKVALDDGMILGVEAQGYIFNHIKRDNLKPIQTEEKARSVINKSVEILSSDIALIPTEYNTEILTYEFKGRIDNRDFLIYINANTLKEEKVLLVIDSKNGILTM